MTAPKSLDFGVVRTRQKAAWMAGDFGEIARFAETNAEEFVKRCTIKSSAQVLDVACYRRCQRQSPFLRRPKSGQAK